MPVFEPLAERCGFYERKERCEAVRKENHLFLNPFCSFLKYVLLKNATGSALSKVKFTNTSQKKLVELAENIHLSWGENYSVWRVKQRVTSSYEHEPYLSAVLPYQLWPRVSLT